MSIVVSKAEFISYGLKPPIFENNPYRVTVREEKSEPAKEAKAYASLLPNPFHAANRPEIEKKEVKEQAQARNDLSAIPPNPFEEPAAAAPPKNTSTGFIGTQEDSEKIWEEAERQAAAEAINSGEEYERIAAKCSANKDITSAAMAYLEAEKSHKIALETLTKIQLNLYPEQLVLTEKTDAALTKEIELQTARIFSVTASRLQTQGKYKLAALWFSNARRIYSEQELQEYAELCDKKIKGLAYELNYQGITSFNTKQYKKAIAFFKEAEAVIPHPGHESFIEKCEEHLEAERNSASTEIAVAHEETEKKL